MSVKKLLVCLVLSLSVCSAVFALADAAVEEFWNYAYSVDKTIYVNASDGQGLFMRYGPGTEYDKVNSQTIPNGTAVHITRECAAENGWKWGWCDYTFPGNSYTDSGWICLLETTTQAPAAAEPTQQADPDPAPAGEETQPAEVQPAESQPVEEEAAADPAEDAEAVPAETQTVPATYSSMSLVIIGIVIGVVAAAAVGLILSRRKK